MHRLGHQGPAATERGTQPSERVPSGRHRHAQEPQPTGSLREQDRTSQAGRFLR